MFKQKLALSLTIGLFLVASPAFAGWSLGLGFESRTQPDVNPDDDVSLSSAVLMGGYRWAKISTQLEWMRFQRETSEGYYSIRWQQDSLMNWWRYQVFQWGIFGVHPGVGTGFYKDQIETKVQSAQQTTKQDWYFSSGLELAFDLHVLKNMYVGSTIRWLEDFREREGEKFALGLNLSVDY